MATPNFDLSDPTQGIELVNALPRPFVCTIEFPPWFELVQLEVYAKTDI